MGQMATPATLGGEFTARVAIFPVGG